MRSSVFLFALGGVLVGSTADASILGYYDGVERRSAWTDASCKELAPAPELKAFCQPGLVEGSAALRGPTGRVLLARDGLTFFEADPDTGAVDTVVTDGKGTLLSVERLVGPLVSKGGKERVLVTARVETYAAETGLISSKLAGERRVVTLTVVTFPPGGVEFDKQELSFDVDTLAPMVSPGVMQSIRSGGGRDTTGDLQYWVPTVE